MEALKTAVATALQDAIRARFGEPAASVALEHPPRPALGDLATPVAFELARRLKRPPQALARELAQALPAMPGVARVEVAGAGYLNIFLERDAAARALAAEIAAPPPAPSGGKIVIEHTNINPNKAAHIGHLRNAVLGDTLARCLRFFGARVEVQNYIDDTGVQVADLIIGFRDILGHGIAEARAVAGRFDHFCWDLYARVTEMYERRPDAAALRAATLKALEERGNPVSDLGDYLTHRIVHCHLDTMARIGVRYDLLAWERDILAGRFWERAFDLLRGKGAVVRVESGERQGCWVMALEGPRFQDLKEGEKIIVRSNGTVTYVGKDIAYQLWKFGLLPSDFRYAPFRDEPGGRRVWTSTQGDGAPDAPAFGRAERVINVIDARQAYLQAIVTEGLRALGYRDQAERSVHFSYEMVALTPKSARALGVPLTEADAARPFVEMSGRRGLGIKADDLLDALEARAAREVADRNPDLEGGAAAVLGRQIAIGALRYLMIKYTRNKVLAFDFDEALSFEGESGPYLQYAVVRAASILRNLAAAGGPDEAAAAGLARDGRFDLPEGEDADEHWALLVQMARFRETVAQAADGLELSQIAKYAFALAQRFNSFYHRYPVLKENDPRWRQARIALIWMFHARMRQICDLIGVPVPERM